MKDVFVKKLERLVLLISFSESIAKSINISISSTFSKCLNNTVVRGMSALWWETVHMSGKNE